MTRVVVGPNDQVALPRAVREKLGISEGDRVIVNVTGEVALLTKKDPDVFRESGSFLPEDFEDVLSSLRSDPDE